MILCVVLCDHALNLLQALNYMRMSSRIDAVAARVQTAITMKQVYIYYVDIRTMLEIRIRIWSAVF